jgi:hypothetical protein
VAIIPQLEQLNLVERVDLAVEVPAIYDDRLLISVQEQ